MEHLKKRFGIKEHPYNRTTTYILYILQVCSLLS